MLKTRTTILFSFVLLMSLLFQQVGHAQCTTTVTTFPYDEDFEATDGNWVPSSALHWVWGQPGTPTPKTLINSAGGGINCWVAGGLSGSSYNSGSSELVSPCFDLSSLVNPEISFKVFWEAERKYDGATFQFTTDGGATWLPLGDENSNSNCLGVNWFNYAPINFLGGVAGWSGNITAVAGCSQVGGGSGQWLTAKHTLSSLIGMTNVGFKFVFGAGTICNDYDGFAIDDIHIGEAPPSGVSDFTYTCGSNNTVAFSNILTPCQTGVVWDFGDIASGVNNSSVLQNPSHTFSTPGPYTVSLTTSYTTGPAITSSKTLNVIGVAAVITNDIKCNADQTGAITVNVNPPGIYNYTWDTSPVQNTSSINNLAAGTYTITVSAVNTCTVSLPVILTEPAVLSISPIISDAKCGSNNGSISSNVTGGTMPYNYVWSNAAITPSINNLSPGNYSLSLTDNNGCTASANNLLVNNVVVPAYVFLGKDTSICTGETLVLQPGSFASYTWQDNSVLPTFNVTQSGTYYVDVTDFSGCIGSDTIQVIIACDDIFFPSAFTPNQDRTNETFGPLGNSVSSMRDYSLTIYNRFGQLVFSSNDPYKKWDGTFKGKLMSTQTFVWVASYTINGKQTDLKKGTITIFH